MPDSTHNVEQLLKRIEETLVATIPGTIRQMEVDERAYCVFIVFHDTTVVDDYRSHLVVAAERLRRELFESKQDAADIVWNPSLLDVHEVSPGCVVEGPDLKEAFHELYRALIDDWNDERTEEDAILSPIRLTMHRIARALNQLNWCEVLETTDDFVVVAIDDNGWDPQADMRACINPQRLALLDSRGLFENRTATCPQCGKDLPTPQAKQCFDCGADWH